jgi:hypothetical protein
MRGLVGIGAVMSGLLCLSLVHLGAHTRITTTVTWDREISPIIQTRCARCHSPGGRAPMSLATYEAARPWARAIRHEVLTRRMPKWHAARGFGEFANDPSLSPFEIQLMTAWVDGGAPKSLPGSMAPSPSSIEMKPAVERRYRETTIRCADSSLPIARLMGLQPRLDAGGSVRVTAQLPDGRREILGWFRDFDPDFAPSYMLWTPLMLPAGSRLVTEVSASQSCSLVLWIE